MGGKPSPTGGGSSPPNLPPRGAAHGHRIPMRMVKIRPPPATKFEPVMLANAEF